MNKLLGIGLQRTGTTSLYHATKQLGIRAAPHAIDLFYDLNAPVIHQYDFFADNPIPLLYKQLDTLYPNSRFILTTRPLDDWLTSVEWLFTNELKRLPPHLQKVGDEIHTRFYGRTTFDDAVFRAKWDSYHAEVHHYFAQRPQDLLEIDLTQETRPWDQICPFLNLSKPSTPFPHSNQRHPKQATSLLKRLKNWLK